MGKVATANVSKHLSKKVLCIESRCKEERPPTTVPSNNFREQMPGMKEERSSIVSIFWSRLVCAEHSRRQKKNVISIGVDIDWERWIDTRGITRLQA